MTRDPTDDHPDEDRRDATSKAADDREYLSERPRRTDEDWRALFDKFEQRRRRVKSRRHMPEPGAPHEGPFDPRPLVGFEKLDDALTVELVREALTAPSRAEIFLNLADALDCAEEDVCVTYRREVERDGRRFAAQVLSFPVNPANADLWGHGSWFHPETKLWSLPPDASLSAKALEKISPHFRYFVQLDPLVVLTRVERTDNDDAGAPAPRGAEPGFNWR